MTSVRILRGESMKVGDTRPVLRVKLLEDGNPFNLTGYSVDMVLQLANDDSVMVDGSAAVDVPRRGIVTYDWGVGETDSSGTYNLEFVAKDGTDEITFPNSGTATVYVEERL